MVEKYRIFHCMTGDVEDADVVRKVGDGMDATKLGFQSFTLALSSRE